MHPIKNSYYILGSLSYLLIQFCRQQDLIIPELLNNYVTDFLFMPLLLLTTLWLTRLIKRKKQLVFSVPMLITVFIYVSFVFEYYLPQTSTVYTADYLDIVMYFFGTVFYYFLQKKIEG
jgi:hypothetical protein